MKIIADRLILESQDIQEFLSYDHGINGFEVADALGQIQLNHGQVKHISVPEEYIHLQKTLDDQWNVFLIKKSKEQ